MPITVKELIQQLLEFDQSLPVRIETKDGEETPLKYSDVCEIYLGTSNKRVLLYLDN